MQTWTSISIPDDKLASHGVQITSKPRIWNTETQAINEITEKEIKLYVCGITPYDATHMGHAATYLTFDL